MCPVSTLSGSKDVSVATLGVGVGLRAPHYRAFLEQRPKVDWLEVHTENYLNPGGWDRHVLTRLRAHYPISLHGVGLGIGSARALCHTHLQRIKDLVDAIEPVLISEHLCWGAAGERHLNDLLPLPMTDAVLTLVCDRVDRLQSLLGRQVLLENVSTYLRFRDDVMSEAQLLAEVVSRTGCGVLLDVNNLYVNQCNHQENALTALHELAPGSIGEIHLAGHLVTPDAVVDHHGDRVAAPVWQLYRQAMERFGQVPTLIEWDTDLPALEILLDEASKARDIASACSMHSPLSINAPGVKNVPQICHPSSSVAALDAQQRLFASALLDHKVEHALLPVFQGKVEARQPRLALYRGNLSATWSKTLRAAYPVLHALVGNEFFDGMARQYGKLTPSSSGDLNCMGEQLAGFLAVFEPAKDYPYFPEMARLEWACHQAYFAGNRPLLAPTDLARLAPPVLEQTMFAMHPGFQLFRSDWAVAELWLAHQSDSDHDFPAQMACVNHAMVVRPHWKSHIVLLVPAAYAGLRVLHSGGTFGQALDAAFDVDPDFDVGFHLQHWLQHGVFSALEAASPSLAHLNK